jgi:predicted outer membrane repeat protein
VTSLTMQRCSFTNNHVGGKGGVARFFLSGVAISDSVATGNTADNGGAFAVEDSTLQLSGCTFAGNRARGSGGAVYSVRSIVTATNTTFSGNSASVGGAWFSDSLDTLTLAHCKFVANHAAAGSGGALRVLEYCSVAATSTRFVNNSALMDGGAVSSRASSNTTLAACTFTDNSASGIGGALQLGTGNRVAATATRFEGNGAAFGGAIASFCQNTVDLVGCKLVLNAAADLGGALHVADGSLDVCQGDGSPSSLVLSMCSLHNNTAGVGGGAAYVANGAGLNSSSNEFVFNYVGAGEGGAVLLETNSSWGCSNTSFIRNQAMQGGAVAATQSATASFSGGCVFSGNAAVEGGAVLVDGAGVVLEGSTLQGNTAQRGGALLARNVAHVTLGPGVQLVGNAAQLFGGGMLVDFECTQQVRFTGRGQHWCVLLVTICWVLCCASRSVTRLGHETWSLAGPARTRNRHPVAAQ